ncbi:MAG: sodium:solute symporter [Saprospiraceae bacterium]|jgi:Na+/proline symporter
MIQQLTPGLILGIIIAYFALLIVISYFTGKKSDSASFFLAGRQAPWMLVAFGMIGTSISGVSFVSTPGVVGGDGLNKDFSYMQVVFGYLLGYVAIGTVLMPLYYRLQLTSIYTYLENRLGFFSYKTGSAYFLISRTVGAAFRLFLAASILHEFVLSAFGVPFWLTVLISIALIWTYTFRGGMNTIIYTDSLQTFFLLAALVLTIISVGKSLDLGPGGIFQAVAASEYSQALFFEGGWSDPNNFFKQFFGGALITLTMSGLDQDIMQKNLSCRSLKDAQKNMFVFSIIMVVTNVLFLTLGALLYIYMAQTGMEAPAKTDLVYPTLALQHFAPLVGILFILGITAATYASSDSALAALTTAFCVDFLNFEKSDAAEATKKRQRTLVHLGFSLLLFIIIVIFKQINNQAVLSAVFIWAGYTYGPLLGLFGFGILTRRNVRDKWVLPICIASPILSYFLDKYSADLFAGFKFGFLLLLLNGLITFLGLLLISTPAKQRKEEYF